MFTALPLQWALSIKQPPKVYIDDVIRSTCLAPAEIIGELSRANNAYLPVRKLNRLSPMVKWSLVGVEGTMRKAMSNIDNPGMQVEDEMADNASPRLPNSERDFVLRSTPVYGYEVAPGSGVGPVIIRDSIPVRPQTLLERWKSKGGLLGTIASILLFLAKAGTTILALLSQFKFLAIALKLLLGGGSMLVSMWLMSKAFGWSLAAGVVLLIFVHECGHAFAARLRGIQTGIMVFIPFLGAFVTTKRFGKSLEEDAFIGIMGPIVGSLASAMCVCVWAINRDPYWLMLGKWGLFINLFNLLPTAPLDGGWIVPLFSPKLLAVGMVIALVVGFRNPLIWALLVLSLPRIIYGWKADPKTQPYYRVPTAVKLKYGAAYIGLAATLAASGFLLPGSV